MNAQDMKNLDELKEMLFQAFNANAMGLHEQTSKLILEMIAVTAKLTPMPSRKIDQST